MRWIWLLPMMACTEPEVVAPDVPTPPATEVVDAMLVAHNEARASLGVPPLTWSDTLTAASASWLLELDDRGCILEHTDDGPYGENLYWSSVPSEPQEVVDTWVAEVADYDYAANRCAPGAACGHYTQVVWTDTTQVGCAKQRCAGGLGQLWMCSYDPPGNYVGERPY